MFLLRLPSIIGLMVCIATSSFAAEKAAPLSSPLASKGPSQVEMTYDDPLGRSTPQGTVVGFLRAVQREDYDRAIDYLDTRQTGKRAHQLAVELQVVLDRGLSNVTAMLSSKPEGNLTENLPANRENVGGVKTKTTKYIILLERIQRENDPPIWLFSSETLKLIPKIYEEIGTPWIEQYLPLLLTETSFAGSPLYRWLVLILIIPLACVIAWLITKMSVYLIRKSLRRHLDESLEQKMSRLSSPLWLLITAGGVYVISLASFSMLGRIFWVSAAVTITVIGLTWLSIRVIDIVAELSERHHRRMVPSSQAAALRLMWTLMKILAVITGLISIFYSAGVNLTAVVAGLGIGGIAVAFAAQKTLENLFGGLVLAWDAPIRLIMGEYRGAVEDIGLRSTRIRTHNRTVVSIPNGQLSTMSVENFTLREKILFNHTRNLRYETTADQLRYVLAEIRALLYQHSRVESSTARIRFVALGSSSLDLEIFGYVLETSYEAFLAVQEDLLLRIMYIVESSGSGFAFPSQTIYASNDSGLDAEKGREAAARVQRWRDQGELAFPDFPQEKISEIENKLQYPPTDSALHLKKER